MAVDKRLTAAGSSAATGFGERLRTARERRGLSLRQVADSTKISLPILEALERDDPSRLPGGIFSRSFVRSFAAEVGLDPEEELREFERAFPQHAPRPELVTPEAIEPIAVESHRLWPWVLVAVLLLSGLTVAALSYLGWRRPVTPATEVASGVPERPAPSPSARPGPPPPLPAASAETARASGADTTPPAALPPGPPVAGAQVATPTGQGASPSQPTAARPTPPVPAGALRIVLEPRAECWVEVRGDSTVLLSRVLKPGERVELAADEVLQLAVGDAGALAYTLNGQAGRSLGRPGQVVRARIDRATLTDFVVR
jgi:cytoskeleton protein RodZ